MSSVDDISMGQSDSIQAVKMAAAMTASAETDNQNLQSVMASVAAKRTSSADEKSPDMKKMKTDNYSHGLTISTALTAPSTVESKREEEVLDSREKEPLTSPVKQMKNLDHDISTGVKSVCDVQKPSEPLKLPLQSESVISSNEGDRDMDASGNEDDDLTKTEINQNCYRNDDDRNEKLQTEDIAIVVSTKVPEIVRSGKTGPVQYETDDGNTIAETTKDSDKKITDKFIQSKVNVVLQWLESLVTVDVMDDESEEEEDEESDDEEDEESSSESKTKSSEKTAKNDTTFSELNDGSSSYAQDNNSILSVKPTQTSVWGSQESQESMTMLEPKLTAKSDDSTKLSQKVSKVQKPPKFLLQQEITSVEKEILIKIIKETNLLSKPAELRSKDDDWAVEWLYEKCKELLKRAEGKLGEILLDTERELYMSEGRDVVLKSKNSQGNTGSININKSLSKTSVQQLESPSLLSLRHQKYELEGMCTHIKDLKLRFKKADRIRDSLQDWIFDREREKFEVFKKEKIQEEMEKNQNKSNLLKTGVLSRQKSNVSSTGVLSRRESQSTISMKSSAYNSSRSKNATTTTNIPVQKQLQLTRKDTLSLREKVRNPQNLLKKTLNKTSTDAIKYDYLFLNQPFPPVQKSILLKVQEDAKTLDRELTNIEMKYWKKEYNFTNSVLEDFKKDLKDKEDEFDEVYKVYGIIKWLRSRTDFANSTQNHLSQNSSAKDYMSDINNYMSSNFSSKADVKVPTDSWNPVSNIRVGSFDGEYLNYYGCIRSSLSYTCHNNSICLTSPKHGRRFGTERLLKELSLGGTSFKEKYESKISTNESKDSKESQSESDIIDSDIDSILNSYKQQILDEESEIKLDKKAEERTQKLLRAAEEMIQSAKDVVMGREDKVVQMVKETHQSGTNLNSVPTVTTVSNSMNDTTTATKSAKTETVVSSNSTKGPVDVNTAPTTTVTPQVNTSTTTVNTVPPHSSTTPTTTNTNTGSIFSSLTSAITTGITKIINNVTTSEMTVSTGPPAAVQNQQTQMILLTDNDIEVENITVTPGVEVINIVEVNKPEAAVTIPVKSESDFNAGVNLTETVTFVDKSETQGKVEGDNHTVTVGTKDSVPTEVDIDGDVQMKTENESSDPNVKVASDSTDQVKEVKVEQEQPTETVLKAQISNEFFDAEENTGLAKTITADDTSVSKTVIVTDTVEKPQTNSSESLDKICPTTVPVPEIQTETVKNSPDDSESTAQATATKKPEVAVDNVATSSVESVTTKDFEVRQESDSDSEKKVITDVSIAAPVPEVVTVNDTPISATNVTVESEIQNATKSTVTVPTITVSSPAAEVATTVVTAEATTTAEDAPVKNA